jgi:hypothetical protein
MELTSAHIAQPRADIPQMVHSRSLGKYAESRARTRYPEHIVSATGTGQAQDVPRGIRRIRALLGAARGECGGYLLLNAS